MRHLCANKQGRAPGNRKDIASNGLRSKSQAAWRDPEREGGHKGRAETKLCCSILASGNFLLEAALPRALQGRDQPCIQVISTRKESREGSNWPRWENPGRSNSTEAAAVCR